MRYLGVIMFGLGIGELLLIVAIIVLLFGSKKIPQLAKGMGEGIREFKKSVKGDAEEEKKIID